jgi:hypothetical protein
MRSWRLAVSGWIEKVGLVNLGNSAPPVAPSRRALEQLDD